ncbi:LacI family DNA-binding transcriptional regulator [Celeribacter litoreus]|uniref:LacI family DNA-binding transcriptional regulator n=1 Tax=Celeribacter litoreus TaxID=2876714 RepID=UPI001CCF3934|nr:LacI family DNA-binding transcriptional regulator [Celeribacter litoreus]MCA0042568.1 LacI family DNA-binding transcriptional regulator [Celeribacter litoreus]
MPKHSKRVTLEDVARAVGVSTITVSRALRRPEMVSEGLRTRITTAVAELGYVPDPSARALASRRSNVIGVLIPSVTNNVFADVLSGLYDTVTGTPYYVQLANTRYIPSVEEDLIRIFLSQRPAGLIVAGIDQSTASRALLEQADCPVVQIMDVSDTPVDMIVGFSHRDAARAATEHLFARGYKAPAFIGARMDPRSERRLAGFSDAIKAAGPNGTLRKITTAEPSSTHLGSELFDKLMELEPETDAIFCNNDDLALGAQFAAQRRGLTIGRDIGICGFNDLEVMGAAYPSITSIRTFRREMGELAARKILARLTEEDAGEPIIDLKWQLCARDSTDRS